MQIARYLPRTQLSSLVGMRSASIQPLWKSYSSAGTNTQASRQDQSQEAQEKGNELIGLPEPSAEAIKLDVSSGEGVRLDDMGPMVVNKDGTISRITNWDKMAPIEKENTLRVLGKRNKQRLAALKKTDSHENEPKH